MFNVKILFVKLTKINIYKIFPIMLNVEIIFNPLEQFEIRDYLSLNISFLNNMKISLTNISIYLTIGFLILIFFNTIENNYNRVIYNK